MLFLYSKKRRKGRRDRTTLNGLSFALADEGGPPEADGMGKGECSSYGVEILYRQDSCK